MLDVDNGLAEQDPVIAAAASTQSLTALNVTLSQLRAGYAGVHADRVGEQTIGPALQFVRETLDQERGSPRPATSSPSASWSARSRCSGTTD